MFRLKQLGSVWFLSYNIFTILIFNMLPQRDNGILLRAESLLLSMSLPTKYTFILIF